MSIPPPPPAPGPYDQQPVGNGSSAAGSASQAPAYGSPNASFGSPSGAPGPTPSAHTPWYKKWWTWLIGCGCLLVAAIAVILVVVLLMGMLGGPKKTVNNFIDAWNDRDCKTLSELTTADARSTLQAGCEELVKSAKSDDDVMPKLDYDITDTTVNGDHAVVEGTMKYTANGEDKVETSKFTLVKEDGDWKIDDIGTI